MKDWVPGICNIQVLKMDTTTLKVASCDILRFEFSIMCVNLSIESRLQI